MTFAKFTKCLIGFVPLLFALCGFAGEPTLQSIQTFSTPEKIKKVIFLYEEKNFDFKETRYGGYSSINNPRAFLGDTEFPGFGDLLVTQASASFAIFGLSVTHSGYAPEGRLKDYQKELQEQLGSEFQESVIIVVTPSSANTVGHSVGLSTVNVQLSVTVRNAKTAQPIWAGLVNTSTRVGKGFITSRIFTQQLYDQAYAVAVLDLLANAWRKSEIF